MGRFFKVNDFSLVPSGSPQAETDLSSVVTLTVPEDSNGVLLQAFTDTIYYTIDGTDATASNGFALTTDEGVVRFDLYPGAEVKLFSSSGEARWQYFRLSGGTI